MPYISDAERERERWMMLAEAVTHVEDHDGCDHRSALEQLCNAICDRRLRTKWEDRKWFDWEPERASFLARIRISDAKVADPDTGEWRTLLVLKDDVLRIWPEPSLASAGSEGGKARPITEAKRGGRPSAEDDIHQALDQLSLGGLDVQNTNRKELVALVNEECSKPTGKNPEYSMRVVQKHLSSWLKKH